MVFQSENTILSIHFVPDVKGVYASILALHRYICIYEVLPK